MISNARRSSADAVHADVAAARDALRIRFDDLGEGAGELPAGYNHLVWQNMNWATAEELVEVFGPSGYDRGVVSGGNIALGGAVGDVVITTGGGNFDFESVFVTAAWRQGMTVDVYGSDDGVELYHKSFVVDDLTPMKFKLNFDGVDAVTFVASGGTKDPDVVGDGTVMVFDNVVLHAPPGAIQGHIFNDRDGDGVQDAREKGLAGRTVFDDANGNGVLDAGEANTVTSADGGYLLSGLSFGAHTIAQVVPAGWVQTSPLTDAFDYTAAKSDYHWIDIANPANDLNIFGYSDGAAAVLISQPVSFYGVTEGTEVLTVAVNGLATFLFDGYDNHNNTGIPDPTTPNAILAPFWDDLTLGRERTGAVYFLDDPEAQRAIIEWKDVRLYSGDVADTLTFEVILHYDGTIEYQYEKMHDHGKSATVGIENFDGSLGTEWSYNENVIESRSAITFTPFAFPVPTAAHVQVDAGGTTFGVDFGQQREASLAAFGGGHLLAWEPLATGQVLA